MLIERLKSLLNKIAGEKGSFLIQTLVALALMALIGTAILSALAATSTAVGIADERDTARNLAVSQMECIKKMDWQTVYEPADISSEYTDKGYSVKEPIIAQTLSSRDGNIQKIEITILHGNKEVVTLESYKVY